MDIASHDNLEGRVALVTGGGRGIGAAVALELGRRGADVALTYVDGKDPAEAVAARIRHGGRRAAAIRADSADPSAVTAAVDGVVADWGRLDILVNNAATFLIGPVGELTLDDFDRTVAVNAGAASVASQAAARHMGAGGRIVTIGSNVAERSVLPGFSLYSMSKAALVGLTKALGRELGPRAITVNLVSPGPTDTDLSPADSPHAAMINAFTALGHYADPADVAAVVAFLASPGSRYVTGTTVHVDGGFTS